MYDYKNRLHSAVALQQFLFGWSLSRTSISELVLLSDLSIFIFLHSDGRTVVGAYSKFSTRKHMGYCVKP
jgi:hypothetical protein